MRAICRKDFEKLTTSIEIDKSPVKDFLKSLSGLDGLLSGVKFSLFRQTLDSIQAVRPFYPELIKIYIKDFHILFTDYCKKYWNKRMKEFDVWDK